MEILLPTSSQSLAMGISGTMDSTLLSLGVSFSGMLKITQEKTINETIEPLIAILKIDASPNGITAPIIQATNTLINNVANLGPKDLMKLLTSLLMNIKSVMISDVNINSATLLSSNVLASFIKIYSAGLYNFQKITELNEPSVNKRNLFYFIPNNLVYINR